MHDKLRCPFCGGATFKPVAVSDLAWCATCHRLFALDLPAGAGTAPCNCGSSKEPGKGSAPARRFAGRRPILIHA